MQPGHTCKFQVLVVNQHSFAEANLLVELAKSLAKSVRMMLKAVFFSRMSQEVSK